MLKLTHLTAGYKNYTVLKNISATFSSGSLNCIVGKNGCGKSTLLKAIDCLIPSTGGISVDDIEINTLTIKERSKQIAYLPQVRPTPCIDGKLLIEHGRFPHLDFSKTLRTQDNEIVAKAIEITDTYGLLNKNLIEMSGGERQKIYIASALAQETPILLFDEPTTHLDFPNQIEILELMQKLKDNGKTVIAVLHDIVEAFSYSDKILIMDSGEIVDFGPPSEIYKSEYLKKIFGISLLPNYSNNAVFKFSLVK